MENKARSTEQMKLVRVIDLIGQNVAGVKADMRSRTADGELMYDHQAKDGPRIVTMKAVETHTDKTGRWMRWTWEGKGHPQPLACGFSGVVMDGKHEFDYHIEMEVRPVLDKQYPDYSRPEPKSGRISDEAWSQ